MNQVIFDKTKEIKKFMTMDIMFCFAVFVCCYQNVVRSYNTTMLALSYEYGFTSRSLLGTIYHVLDALLPLEMMDYGVVLHFAQIVTGLFFLFLMYFSYICLKHCKEEAFGATEFVLFSLDIVTVATFSSAYNFFRVDLFMMLVAMICALLLVNKKAEWLVIPMSCIGVMFHQGFVFMYFNVALVLLLYLFLSSDKKGKVKYGIIFAVSFLAGSALFLWFEFFSRTNGAAIIDQVVADARAVSFEGKYHSTLLAHEVLGVDLSGDESEWHKMNILQMGCFVVLMLPYLMIFIRFFKGLFKKAATAVDKWKYFFVLAGACTMLPDFLLKIDYGRWVMAVVAYYTIVLVALVVLGDQGIRAQLSETYDYYKNKEWGFLLLLYPIMLVPLGDVDINGFVQQISAWLNANVLDWYHF